MNPEQVLNVAADASPEEIESAYDRHMGRWQPLLSHPTRGTEAEEMIARLDAARREMLARLDAGEGGLRVDESVTVTRGSGPRKTDKDVCPECGYGENPPDARFCINCQRVLVQQCPNPQCRSELPWHQDICHRCGTDVERFRIEQEEQARRCHEEAIRQREMTILELRNDFAAADRVSVWLGPFSPELSRLGEKYGVSTGRSIAKLNVILLVVLAFVVLPFVAMIGEGLSCLYIPLFLAVATVLTWPVEAMKAKRRIKRKSREQLQFVMNRS